MDINVGDYSSKKTSLLSECEQIHECDGMLHSGIIHYVQSKVDDVVLKAAIYSVLDNVPSVYPLNFKEILEKDDFEPTDEQTAHFGSLNSKLFVPISGYDVAEIIELAKQFLSEYGKLN